MKTLTATQDKINGFWRIKFGRKTVGALVQPSYALALNILPTAVDIRNAVREVSPHLAITNETAVVVVENR